MKQLAILVCLLVSMSACRSDSARLPTDPSASSGQTATTAVLSVPSPITLGKEVSGVLNLHGAERVYELTAVSDGTLIARVAWVPAQGRLQLDLADEIFANFPDNRSPIVGELPVLAGRKYRIRISDGAPWDYDELNLPFVLTTSIK